MTVQDNKEKNHGVTEQKDPGMRVCTVRLHMGDAKQASVRGKVHWGCSTEGQHLFSMHNAMGSVPSAAEKTVRKRKYL